MFAISHSSASKVNSLFGLHPSLGVYVFDATVSIVALVTATNNYQKEKQFRALEDKEEQKCVVVRNGGEQIILAEHVLVGDIMVIRTGDAIIADALFISGAGMHSRQMSSTWWVLFFCLPLV